VRGSGGKGLGQSGEQGLGEGGEGAEEEVGRGRREGEEEKGEELPPAPPATWVQVSLGTGEMAEEGDDGRAGGRKTEELVNWDAEPVTKMCFNIPPSLSPSLPSSLAETQCEEPSCMKWRRLPWFVEEETLPSPFFCALNT